MMVVSAASSCSNRHENQMEEIKRDSSSNLSLFNAYDVSDRLPSGDVNPNAPIETRQFDFLVGSFICKDSLFINGEWHVSDATWETTYMLNGFGVRDVYRNDKYAGESMRIYNAANGKWDVHFFGMPGGHSGVWQGEWLGDKMVMKQARFGKDGQLQESRLTFYDIRDNGFEWMAELWDLASETAITTWKISARRTLSPSRKTDIQS